MFVNTKKAKEMLGICSGTLRNWDRQGKVKTMQTPGGMRLYDVSSVVSSTTRIIYARVSSRNQDDLENQIAYFKNIYLNHELITDIGSGLNFKRKGFNALLERILSSDVAEIVVTYRDRLCRFGFELIGSIAKKYNCRIVVLDESQLSPQTELVSDLLSIIHVFSRRLYGLRKYSRQIKEDSDLPKKSTHCP
jgi:predicted site-specific integrase-resolvase